MNKGKVYKKRLETFIEGDKITETRVQDVAWLCSLSESEIDMLISLKLLIIKRAEWIGCKNLANKFDLKMLRAIALVLMENLKAEVKDASLVPDMVKSTAFLDVCNLLNCNSEVSATIEELSTSVGADIQPILQGSSLYCSPSPKRKKQKVAGRSASLKLFSSRKSLNL
ncbi:putative gamma-tubulin complex component protein [Medicago truncatula]|uniref:Putative gamma-tubulin complex component protein n=1 Tax=Medicago truncatula TaxID=3880 RepID=G7LEC6_MEDTR|nr:uncharacterized protein LOC11435005 [Medicago truncatula]AET01350.1 Spc97/Spc98 family of spindle pole body (SBP) component, putative [Medicago truncatula]RHN38948.1 putative gamma-tubulin complex component protein [Medicago truncatula]